MTRPGTGPKPKNTEDKNRQEENMDIEEDMYSVPTPAQSKYIKQAKNVSKSNADKQNSEVKVRIDSETVEKDDQRKYSAKQKGITFGGHSENIKNTDDGEKEKMFNIEKTIVVQNGRTSPADDKKTTLPRTPKERKKFSIELRDSKANVDKFETEKLFQPDNRLKNNSEFKYFNNVSLESRVEMSEDDMMDDSSAKDSSSTPTTEELEISIGNNSSESKYLKKKTSPDLEFRIYKPNVKDSSSPEQPPSTPKEPRYPPTNSYMSTNKSSTYTVNVQAPYLPSENTDSPPIKHSSPHQERKKVSDIYRSFDLGKHVILII